MRRSHRAAAILSAAALLATTVYVGLTAGTAGALQGCVPGETQVAVFQLKNFGGRCAIFGKGAHPDITSGAVSGSVMDNSVSSIKIGVHAAAVVHENPNFGGNADNSWESFTSDVADLSPYQYHNNADSVDDSISALWVMQQGCVPQGKQFAVFDQQNFGGACVIVKPGSYSDVVSAGFPNDWAGSIKTGGSATGTAWIDIPFANASCSYTQSASYPFICFGDDQMSSLQIVGIPGG
jgi:hypothetical protein